MIQTTGNAGPNIPDASKERDNKGASGFSRIYSIVFLVCKASGGWRPVIDLKQLNAHIFAPHFRMSNIGSVPSTVRKEDFAFKINRSEECLLLCTNPSRQLEVPTLCIREQSLQFRVLQFGLNTAPSGIYLSGAHSGSLPSLSRDISNPISQRLVIHTTQTIKFCFATSLSF